MKTQHGAKFLLAMAALMVFALSIACINGVNDSRFIDLPPSNVSI